MESHTGTMCIFAMASDTVTARMIVDLNRLATAHIAGLRSTNERKIMTNEKQNDETTTMLIKGIPADVHQQFKSECAKAGLTMREKLIQLMAEYRCESTQTHQE